jgi:hypothetical protein
VKYLSSITVGALYLIFSFASILAGLWGLASLPFGTAQISQIAQSMDRTLNAMLGGSSRETVSRRCGKSNCFFCVLLCKILDKILQPGHCAEEAKD